MNAHRLFHFFTILAAAASICIGSLSALAQKSSTSAPVKKPCAGLHCAFVRVDHVSKLGNGGVLKYITAFGKAGTYILSCIGKECQVPIEGKEYEYSEQQVEEMGDDRYAFLTGPHVNHEQYHLDVIVPELPLLEVRNLSGQCQSSDRFADEVDCGKWITRKLAIQRASSPDPEAAIAFKSFQELIRANDPDVMSDLAHQDHVYVCFLPAKDEFFEVTYSEPPWISFAPPDAEQVKNGIPKYALTIIGGSEFTYYKNGIGEENMSLHNIGDWIYFPLGDKTDPQSMRRNATSKRARFKGKNIEIKDDRWTLTETYKNQADTETTRTVTIQLGTGRFKETFVLTGTGKDVSERSGRCLIVPSDYF
jgi:hypothetical protein